MLTIATHSGTFHADDVFACTILRLALEHRASHDALETLPRLIRSRDQSILDAADIVFDVGGRYDPSLGRYDHHMRDKPLRPSGEPFSSAGLIWRDYGAQAIQRLCPSADSIQIQRIHQSLDGGLLRDIDLMDNGVMQPVPGHFSTLLESFNLTYDESVSFGAQMNDAENAAFEQAACLADQVLRRAVSHAWAAVIAEQTIAAAAAAAEDPRIIVLDSRLPWENAIFDLNLTKALYVVRPAGQGWTCSAIPPERGSFAQRLSLPEAWAGLRDADLVAASGIADATFCHPARFVCGARSRDGAIALAKAACAE